MIDAIVLQGANFVAMAARL